MNSTYFDKLAPEPTQCISLFRPKVWLLVAIWSFWFPQRLCVFVCQYFTLNSDKENTPQSICENPSDSNQFSDSLWRDRLALQLLVFAGLLALGIVAIIVVIDSSLTMLLTLSLHVPWNKYSLALVTAFTAMVAISVIAGQRDRVEVLMLIYVLFTPALFIAALALMTIESWKTVPNISVAFLVALLGSLPYGLAAGSLFAILPPSIRRRKLAIRQALLVGVVILIWIPLVSADACGIATLFQRCFPGAEATCPAGCTFGHIGWSAVAISLASVFGMTIGLLRPDDWALNGFSRQHRYRRQWDAYEGTRVTSLPERGMSQRIMNLLHENWLLGMQTVFDAREWTNQRTTAVGAIRRLLTSYEMTGQDSLAFDRLRELADNCGDPGWLLPATTIDSVLNSDAWFGARIEDSRCARVIVGFGALIRCEPEKAVAAFTNGLEGELAAEFVALNAVFAEMMKKRTYDETMAKSYGTGYSPNDRQDVWRALEKLNLCRKRIKQTREHSNSMADYQKAKNEIEPMLIEARRAVDQVQSQAYCETRILDSIKMSVIDSFAKLDMSEYFDGTTATDTSEIFDIPTAYPIEDGFEQGGAEIFDGSAI